MAKEPDGAEFFKPETRVRCVYQFTGGSAERCNWEGLFSELLVDESAPNGGEPVKLRSCPNCECPFVVSMPRLRRLGTIE